MKRGDYESESEERRYSTSESDDSDDEDYYDKKVAAKKVPAKQVPAKKTSAVAGPPAKKSRRIDGKAASE